MVAVLAQWGCSAVPRVERDRAGQADSGGEAAEPATPPRVRARIADVPATTTVVEGVGAASAAAASSLFFEHAPVVVLAPENDVSAQARAASAAVALGVPLLLSGSPIDDGGSSVRQAADGAGDSSPSAGQVVVDELGRLAPQAVLAVGRTAADWARGQDLGVSVVAAPDDLDALRSFAELDLAEPTAVPPAQLAGAVGALAHRQPPLLTVEGGSTVEPTADGDADADAPPAGAGSDAPNSARSDAGERERTSGSARGGAEGTGPPPAPGPPNGEQLPPVAAPDRSDDVLAVVEQGPANVAAVATARASGARIVAVTGSDPRADPAAIAGLSAMPLPDRVVALGTSFGTADLLRPRLEVAATGVELPGGGQVLFPHRRVVALYGHPGAPVLGSLGEQGVEAAVARAQETAAGYEGLVAEPVVPAFEIITTVASSAPGPDGDYSAESEVADLRPWVDAAGRAGVYVVLDLQPGRTDFLTQAQRYEELLAEPHVGLALDPEWRLGADQRHMTQIGSVGIDEVNAVAAWLAALTRDRRLPQKLLLLHPFQLRMIADRGRLDTSRDELSVLVHADGFGTPGQKFDTWNALRSDPLAGVWWGWKNFIDEDQPTFTPAQTVAVDPTPWYVSYQ